MSEQVEETITSSSIVADRNQGNLTPSSDANNSDYDDDESLSPISSSGSNEGLEELRRQIYMCKKADFSTSPMVPYVRTIPEKAQLLLIRQMKMEYPSSDAHGNCDITTEDEICNNVGRDDLCYDGDNALHHRNDRMDVNTDTVTADDDYSDDRYMVTYSHEVQELSQCNASDYDNTVFKKKCDTNVSKDSETVSSVSCSGQNIKTRETAMDKAADINEREG